MNSNPNAISNVDGNNILYENGENQIISLQTKTIAKYRNPEYRKLFAILFRVESKVFFFDKYANNKYAKYKDNIDDIVATIEFSPNLTLAMTKFISSNIFFMN